MSLKNAGEQRIFCAIVGAGMTGVALGDRLLSSGTLKPSELVIFDKNAKFGGVWESNKYPGAACDIPSHAYVMRTFLNPDWSKKFSEGKEIQQYYDRYAARSGLHSRTRFNTIVHEARWNGNTFLWEIVIEDRANGVREKWLANVLFDNGGGFYRPKYANIPGIDTFKGEQFHTAQWPEGIDLRGKRVALIGTGPSAAQVAPKIQPIVKKLYMFQRSCGHVLPRNNHEVSGWKQFLFRWCYPLLWLYHVSWFIFFDRTRNMWASGTKQNQQMHESCIAFLEREVKDSGVKEKLRPNSEFGCKRVLFLDDWYSLFNNPNVELVREKPVSLTKHGIVSKPPHVLDGREIQKEPIGAYVPTAHEPNTERVEREIDVLIWGTGFDMNDSGGHFQVYGKGGRNLSQTWKDYPKTYWGVAVTEFPNFFLTLGPNSVNYWSNLTTIVQIQIDYHCKNVKRIKRESRKSPYAMYPDPKVTEQYNQWLKENRGTPSFLAPTCATYHKTPAGATPMYNHYRIWYYYWRMLWPSVNEFVEVRK